MPIRLAFVIDFQDEDFQQIIRAFSLRKPMPVPGRLSWSLDKVLSPLATFDPEVCSLPQLLDKIIFLIALAMGGVI